MVKALWRKGSGMTAKYAAYDTVRRAAHAENPDPYGDPVDEAALLTARHAVKELSSALPDIRLSQAEWGRLQAILQKEIATAIRRSAFPKDAFPPLRGFAA